MGVVHLPRQQRPAPLRGSGAPWGDGTVGARAGDQGRAEPLGRDRPRARAGYHPPGARAWAPSCLRGIRRAPWPTAHPGRRSWPAKTGSSRRSLAWTSSGSRQSVGKCRWEIDARDTPGSVRSAGASSSSRPWRSNETAPAPPFGWAARGRDAGLRGLEAPVSRGVRRALERLPRPLLHPIHRPLVRRARLRAQHPSPASSGAAPEPGRGRGS